MEQKSTINNPSKHSINFLLFSIFKKKELIYNLILSL